MKRIFVFIAALFAATTLHAQTYPDRQRPGLNDLANMVDDDTELRINDKITDILQTHGVDVAVLTLSSLRFYAQDSTIEAYGLGLFNEWAVGNPDDNNGILLLVFREDRIVRIVLGSGYAEDAQQDVARIIDEDVTPNFAAGDYNAGIEGAVDGLLARLIAPPPANATTPSGDPTERGNILYYILGVVVAAVAGIFGLNRRAAAKLAATPCVKCGKTGLQRSREVLVEATTTDEGQGETRLTCPSCGHVDATPYTISKRKADTPDTGGKSDGKGATGKW